ncbi:MAG: transporter substrate-binding domain-containing protein [Pseudomonadota bacterium]
MRVIAVALALMAGAASAADLNICVEGAYPPFSYTTEDGTVQGFDIDVANALCAELGTECALVKSDWDGIIPALLERKCDAIIASMSITEERQQVIDFSTKYYHTPPRFVGPAGMSVADLSDAVVGVQRGTIHQVFMEGEFSGVELRLYGTQDEAYLDLAAGRIDAIMADSIASLFGFLQTEAGAGFEFFGPEYTMPKYHGLGVGVGVRKGEEDLRNSFSHAIGQIRGNGVYQEINDKYFDFDIFGG